MLRETIVLGEDERSDARAGEGTQRFVLVVLSGAQVGQRFVLGKPNVTIGRGPEADIHLEEQISSAALHDGLTGAFNRAAFDREIDLEVARSARHDQPLSLLMFDIDYFKAVNDTHGHPAGDAVLREFVDRLRAITRAEDYLARFGGEEFMMVCIDIDATAAKRLADRALSVISSEPFRAGEVSLNVTVSIGIADLAALTEPSVDALVEAADAALYRAKAAGRNRVAF
jgi:two-component system, cell cycle response regulator